MSPVIAPGVAGRHAAAVGIYLPGPCQPSATCILLKSRELGPITSLRFLLLTRAKVVPGSTPLASRLGDGPCPQALEGTCGPHHHVLIDKCPLYAEGLPAAFAGSQTDFKGMDTSNEWKEQIFSFAAVAGFLRQTRLHNQSPPSDNDLLRVGSDAMCSSP